MVHLSSLKKTSNKRNVGFGGENPAMVEDFKHEIIIEGEEGQYVEDDADHFILEPI